MWKMNLSHIEDETFQINIKDFWSAWQEQKINYEDTG